MEMTTADHLAAVCAAWDSWDDDGAQHWQERCDKAVEDALRHLRPVLVDVDDTPPARCVP